LPWSWDKYRIFLTDSKGNVIMSDGEGIWSIVDEDKYADLIAAAPLMYEALQQLLDAADESDGCQYGTLSTSFVRDIAEAALKLARGEL
jgi:hypothetical protein